MGPSAEDLQVYRTRTYQMKQDLSSCMALQGPAGSAQRHTLISATH